MHTLKLYPANGDTELIEVTSFSNPAYLTRTKHVLDVDGSIKQIEVYPDTKDVHLECSEDTRQRLIAASPFMLQSKEWTIKECYLSAAFVGDGVCAVVYWKATKTPPPLGIRMVLDTTKAD